MAQLKPNQSDVYQIPKAWVWALIIVVVFSTLVYFGFRFYWLMNDVETRITKNLKNRTASEEIVSEVRKQINQSITLHKKDSLALLNARLKELEEKNKIEEYIDKKVQEATTQVNEKLDFWGNLGIPLSLVALVSLLVAFYTYINPLIDKLLKEKTEARIASLDEQLAKNQTSFNEIIRQQNIIQEIEKSRKLLIITHNEAEENRQRAFFEKISFKPDFRIISNQDFDNYLTAEPKPNSGIIAELLDVIRVKDLVVFDDHLYKPPKAEDSTDIPNPSEIYIPLILANCGANDAPQKTFFLYYGNYSNAITKHRDIAQAANSEMTLYSRILEVLIFQHRFGLYRNE
jgi:hypothetical protein